MPQQTELAAQFQQYMENPLLWPILEVLRKKPKGWKVHTLASHLTEIELMPILDACAEKDLFKRNFLIMNALYQLQETLYPDNWLQVQAMDIVLMPQHQVFGHEVDHQDPLRDYYLDWHNYEAEEGEVKRLLNEFWTRYREFVGGVDVTDMDRAKALKLFGLPYDASQSEIRKTWRKLALKWHPDRDNGDSDQFRVLCEAWNILRH
ncbi:DNA-J related domain-containing protein [Vibrio sinaloensis]|uniref:DNA-J related domain-containing protein n=1 Tax=Photobacterium sp. (strain ATCC 43367) TaxID=379097 RepID=UPI0035EC6591